MDPRKRLEATRKLRGEALDFHGRFIFSPGKRTAHREYGSRVEPGLHVAQREESSGHQGRSDQKNQRESNLGDNQDVARALEKGTGGGARASFAE